MEKVIKNQGVVRKEVFGEPSKTYQNSIAIEQPRTIDHQRIIAELRAEFAKDAKKYAGTLQGNETVVVILEKQIEIAYVLEIDDYFGGCSHYARENGTKVVIQNQCGSPRNFVLSFL